MKTKDFLFVGLIMAGIALGGSPAFADDTQQAQNQQMHQSRHGDDHQNMADHVRAVAALESIGTVEGWGRAMVTDQLASNGETRRFVLFRVVGLQAESRYTAAVTATVGFDESEITIGEIQTDEFGDGYLRLGRGEEIPPVPENVPPADALILARVYDDSQAMALEGEFTIDVFGGNGPCDIVYLERIVLESPTDPRLKGVARVFRTEEDEQVFESRACRLTADASYQVFLDGTLAGVITTDGVGHGELILATTDGSLPADLQPIEDLRMVDWVDANGDVVLTGTFSGENMAGGHGGGVPGGSGNGDPGGNGDGGGGGNGDGGGGGNGDGRGNGGGNGGGNP